MKLFVQVPCLNEEQTLPMVLESIPTEIPGIDTIEILIIDDGSTDRTVEVARAHGVRHVVSHVRNMGLARSFRDGVDYALAHGADIVVNTDGDNQYPQERIADLVQPLISGAADIVIADRQTAKAPHFSAFKKLMQRFGSHVVNRAAGTDLPDAASGFRAYSKGALLRLNVLTTFSYCMETIIQAGNKRLRIVSVAIETNPKTRESRLFNHIGQHMARSGRAIVRSYLMYKPHVILGTLGTLMLVIAAIPFVRFGVFWLQGDGTGHVQSLIFGTAMLIGALLSFALLVIADLQRTNRVLLEETLERVKVMQYPPSAHTTEVPTGSRSLSRIAPGQVTAEAAAAVEAGLAKENDEVGPNHAGANGVGRNHPGANHAGANHAGANHVVRNHTGANHAGRNHTGPNGAGANGAGANDEGPNDTAPSPNETVQHSSGGVR